MEIKHYEKVFFYPTINYHGKELNCHFHYTQVVKGIPVNYYRGIDQNASKKEFDYNLSQQTIEEIKIEEIKIEEINLEQKLMRFSKE